MGDEETEEVGADRVREAPRRSRAAAAPDIPMRELQTKKKHHSREKVDSTNAQREPPKAAPKKCNDSKRATDRKQRSTQKGGKLKRKDEWCVTMW